jgi:DNA repair protein RAD7
MGDNVLLDAVGPYCKHLRSLSLYGNEALTDEGVTKLFNIISPLPQLKALNLGRLVQLKDSAISTVVNLFGSSLERLNINGLDELTSYSLKSVFDGGCPNIRELDISWIRDVDDDLFELLVTKNPFVATVKVYGCSKLTEFSLVKKFCNSAGTLIKVVGNEFD